MSLSVVHRLPAEDFPISVLVLHPVTGDVGFAVTFLRPTAGELAKVYIPPVTKWFGGAQMKVASMPARRCPDGLRLATL